MFRHPRTIYCRPRDTRERPLPFQMEEVFFCALMACEEMIALSDQQPLGKRVELQANRPEAKSCLSDQPLTALPTTSWLLERLTIDAPADAISYAEVNESVAFIWNHLAEPLDVETIIRQVPKTRRTIERRFRRQLGRTIRQVVAFARLELAKWLLTETNLPIHEIASRVGYSSSDWMGKAMRQSLGMTPTEFRRHLADN